MSILAGEGGSALLVVRVAVTPLAVVSADGRWSKAAVLSHIGGICTHHKMISEMGGSAL